MANKTSGKAPATEHGISSVPSVAAVDRMTVVYKHDSKQSTTPEAAMIAKPRIGTILPGVDGSLLAQPGQTNPLRADFVNSHRRPVTESVSGVEVFGGDDRRAIDPGLAAAYPFNMIALLEYVSASGVRKVGTGWLLSRRVLVTAGHCVWDKDAGNQWTRSLRAKFGCVDGVPRLVRNAVNFSSVVGWTQGPPDPRYDFGAVILDEPTDLGWFGTWSLTDAELAQGVIANIVGYPGDKYPDLYGHAELLDSTDLDPQMLRYTIDTKAGQSGAPVLVTDATQEPFVVGIHNNYLGASNAATRVNDAVQGVFKQWREIS